MSARRPHPRHVQASLVATCDPCFLPFHCVPPRRVRIHLLYKHLLATENRDYIPSLASLLQASQAQFPHPLSLYIICSRPITSNQALLESQVGNFSHALRNQNWKQYSMGPQKGCSGGNNCLPRPPGHPAQPATSAVSPHCHRDALLTHT